MANAPSFPHPAYARYVLEPQFEESKEHIFDNMIAANVAHTIMLFESGILDKQQAAPLLQALMRIGEEGVDRFTYQPNVEDLFFAVEGRLIELTGPEIGGNLQIARSRNDLAAGMSRMMLRHRIIASQVAILELRTSLVALARKHTDSLMPGITHTQPAQPTTLAHFLLGVIGPLERDFARLQRALEHTNQSSFGVAAFTTTSFPISRETVAELLGFPVILENGYDAIGAGDHIMETAMAMTNCVGSLSRFVHDLLVWSRATEGLLKIDDAFIQISSIMPQKRNPVVLEHIRTRISWVYGEATAVQTMIHSAAGGDTNDVEDPIFIAMNRCFDAFEAVVNLLDAVVTTANFNTELMAERAYQGHMTTTALADALVQEYGIAFRSAHSIVSGLVNLSVATKTPINAAMVHQVSAEVLGTRLEVSEEFVQQALDPRNFIAVRTIYGGCAPEATSAALDSCLARIATDQQQVRTTLDVISAADAERSARMTKIMERTGS
ncbi:MAG: argininosuccinate lyase [Thermomicrobiales bacterium]|nr:argininosuccinate lyase [Thermomicrobiales bacterium]